MRHSVRRFKSLSVALKELEPFVRNGEHLQTGKPFARFGGLRSREILANWLLCVVGNFARGADELSFVTDPTGGDGIICDAITDATWLTEHVMLPRRAGHTPDHVEGDLLRQIELKVSKGGAAYASGKTLIVFMNSGGGQWLPNQIARSLPDPLLFDGVWTVGLQEVERGEYVYGVAHLELDDGNAPAWLVRVQADFQGWCVEQIQ